MRPVYLVRHGQSEWNERRLTQGHVHHPPLTALGREQAQDAARKIAADVAGTLADATVGRIVSSDLVRAEATAQILAEHLGAPIEVDERLREQSLGAVEGLPYEEAWRAVEDHDWSDPSLPVAGGESAEDVRRRVSSALTDLDRSVVTVVVSHADAIRAILAGLADPTSRPEWVDVANGAVARFDAGGEVTWLANATPIRSANAHRRG